MKNTLHNTIGNYLGGLFVAAILTTLCVVGIAPNQASGALRAVAGGSGGGGSVPTATCSTAGGLIYSSAGAFTCNPGITTTTGGNVVVTSGAITNSVPSIDVAQQWTAAGTTYTAAKINVTNTASAAGSLLFDAQVAGSSRFNIGVNGNVVVGNGSSATLKASSAGWQLSESVGGGGLYVFNSNLVGFGTSIGVFQTAIYQNAPGVLEVNNGTAGVFADEKLRSLIVDGTNVATAGAATINKSSGSVTVAAAASTVVVTDSLVTATDNIMATSQQVDTTCAVKAVVPGSGTFTITMTAACTSNNRVGFLRVPIQ